ncbi:uncharacterized protein LOC142231795 [Haematobia irritans]|uniref:uncharacterized protein LOC142231795 n=1 Tax=Haematobia irritans TaxID=7368 RepID=UPI003F4FA34E
MQIMKYSRFLVYCVIPVLFHVNVVHTSFSGLSALQKFANGLEKQRHILLCMTRTCDPLAVTKDFIIDNAIEIEIKEKPLVPETKEFRANKLASIVDRYAPIFLAAAPECHDYNYSCPIPATKSIPPEVYEYTAWLKELISASKCVPLDKDETVTEILSNSVDYIEHDIGNPGSFLKRVSPVAAYIAKELQKLCNQK